MLFFVLLALTARSASAMATDFGVAAPVTSAVPGDADDVWPEADELEAEAPALDEDAGCSATTTFAAASGSLACAASSGPAFAMMALTTAGSL